MSEEHRKPSSLGVLRAQAAERSWTRMPIAVPTLQRNWDKAESIREFLKQYPQRCIQPNETPEAAHRYAGAAELAEKLRDTFWPENEKEED